MPIPDNGDNNLALSAKKWRFRRGSVGLLYTGDYAHHPRRARMDRRRTAPAPPWSDAEQPGCVAYRDRLDPPGVHSASSAGSDGPPLRRTSLGLKGTGFLTWKTKPRNRSRWSSSTRPSTRACCRPAANCWKTAGGVPNAPGSTPKAKAPVRPADAGQAPAPREERRPGA